MHAVEVRDVHKIYRRYGRRKSFGTLKSALLSGGVLKNLRPDGVFQALDGVTLDVRQGSTLGIIGRNGSGKSSLLKLIAGIGKPSSGTIACIGPRVGAHRARCRVPPGDFGAGEVFINGMMLGLSKAEVARRFDEIVAFSELGDFIDEPVKTYSSGMYMRLGFAVAINVDPDVLLVDEVLAVGDEAFTHKCLEKFAEFRRRGKTIVLVTHTLDLITRLCDETLWLDDGRVRAHGDPKRVVDAVPDRGGRDRESDGASRSAAAGREPRRGGSGKRRALGLTGSDHRAGGAPARRWTAGARIRVGPADADPGASACRAPTVRLRLRHRHLHGRRRLLLRHQHTDRG